MSQSSQRLAQRENTGTCPAGLHAVMSSSGTLGGKQLLSFQHGEDPPCGSAATCARRIGIREELVVGRSMSEGLISSLDKMKLAATRVGKTRVNYGLCSADLWQLEDYPTGGYAHLT